MAATIVGPAQGVNPGLPGGLSAAYNITAAQVIMAGSSFLAAISVTAPGTTSGSLTINDASGLVTGQTVTAITAAATAVVTLSTVSGSNPFAVGNSVAFAGIGGMVQIIPVVGLVTAIGGASGAWTVTTNINSLSFSAFTSGGTMASYGISNQILSVPFGSMTAGQTIFLYWPCSYGVLVSAVPGGGSPIYSISFT